MKRSLKNGRYTHRVTWHEEDEEHAGLCPEFPGLSRLAHTAGGARRTWLRGLQEVAKRHLLAVAGHNLGLVMRCLFGAGKPRAFADLAAALRRPFGLFNAWHWPRSARCGARARRPATSLGFQGFRKKPDQELSSNRTAFEWLALAA